MNEAKIGTGIILIIVGAILFEINWVNIINLFGFLLLNIGIIIYVVIVDSIDEKKKKEIIKKNRVYSPSKNKWRPPILKKQLRDDLL